MISSPRKRDHLIQNIRFFFNKFEVLFTDIYSITTREKTDLNVGNEIQNEVR